MPPTTSRKALIRLLKGATESETRLRKRVGRRLQRFGWSSLALQLGVYLVAVILGYSPQLGLPATLGEVGLFILLLLYPLIVFAIPFVTVWWFWAPIKVAMGNPASLMLWNARITAAVDARMLPIIMRRPLDEIEFILLEVRTEKENFERGMSLMAGPIEKLGILPGVLATVVAWQESADEGSFWIKTLAYSITLLYLFGFHAHRYAMRLERLLKLLDLAAVRKKAALTDPFNGSPPAVAVGQAPVGMAHTGYGPSASEH